MDVLTPLEFNISKNMQFDARINNFLLVKK